MRQSSRLRGLAHFREQAGELEVNIEIASFHRQRSAQYRHCIVLAAQFHQQVGIIKQRAEVVGTNAQCLLQFFCGTGKIVLAFQQPRQYDPGIHKIPVTVDGPSQ